MSIDMFPDAAIDYIINHPETGAATVSDQQPEDDRILIEEVPLVVEVTYHNDYAENGYVTIAPGADPFILFRMKQKDGAVHLDVTASLIEGEDELIETLEVFFETMIEERMRRGLIEVAASEAVEPDRNDGSNGWGVDNV